MLCFKSIQWFRKCDQIFLIYSNPKCTQIIAPHRRFSSNNTSQSNLNESSKSKSPYYWNDIENQKKFIEQIAINLQIKDMSDWYKITRKDFMEMGGARLFSKYHDSAYLFCSSVFPHYDWLPWKFNRTPMGYWDDTKNQRKFMDFATKELNIKDIEDWYKVTREELNKIGGQSLLSKYAGSIPKMVSEIYTEHEWLPWKFAIAPRNFWDHSRNQRWFMDWAGKQLGIKELNGWYRVTSKEISELGGARLLEKFNDSCTRLLVTIYPEYNWLPWEFAKTQNNFWSAEKKREFMEWAGNQLGIKDLSDWYKYSAKDLWKLGFPSSETSLFSFLSEAYPEFNWQISEFKHKIKKSQIVLKNMLKSIFPNEEVLEEYRHPDIVTSSGAPLEFDLFYPKLNLAIEYQGIQHYRDVERFHRHANSLTEGKERDLLKEDLCKEKGITMVQVPYWWDRKLASLEATIYSVRPELFQEPPLGSPIPLTPNNTIKESIDKKSEAYQILMGATVWNEEEIEPTGWWMSEKYDGMRLYWTGTEFKTRQGRKVTAPKYIVDLMPNIALDGELWTKYGLYQDAISVLKNKEKWSNAIYWVFDTPSNGHLPFEERVNILKELKIDSKFVNIVDFVKCKGKEHLKEFSDGIIAKGGEGVMLREPHSLYKGGRSSALRKYKPFLDTEVKVVENNFPYGLMCKQLNGKDIHVGFSGNGAEGKDIKKGDVITVKHSGINVYGTLQYPKFFRQRLDVKWNDLIKAL